MLKCSTMDGTNSSAIIHAAEVNVSTFSLKFFLKSSLSCCCGESQVSGYMTSLATEPQAASRVSLCPAVWPPSLAAVSGWPPESLSAVTPHLPGTEKRKEGHGSWRGGLA